MEQTKQSLSNLWKLLRNKEKSIGIDNLSLQERELLQIIMHLSGNNNFVELEKVYQSNIFPRASFFRYLKKLREDKLIIINRDKNDLRKSYIYLSNTLSK